jgi:flagellar assembly factor FliW
MPEQDELAHILGKKSDPIRFPSGLIGLEEWKQFAFVSHPAGGELCLLQSLDDERVSFILVPPWYIMPDYKVTVSEADARLLGYAAGGTVITSAKDELVVFCVVSIQEEPFSVTVNLLGPLVVNRESRVGLQVILTDSNFSARYQILDDPAALAPKNIGEER